MMLIHSLDAIKRAKKIELPVVLSICVKLFCMTAASVSSLLLPRRYVLGLYYDHDNEASKCVWVPLVMTTRILRSCHLAAENILSPDQ